jgi:hypothetical protein
VLIIFFLFSRCHKKIKSGSYSFIWNLATDKSYLQEVQATGNSNIEVVNDLLSAIHKEACIHLDYGGNNRSTISDELALFSRHCMEERNTAAHPSSKPQKDVRLQVLHNLQTLGQVKGGMPVPYDELGNLLEAGIKFGKARASGKSCICSGRKSPPQKESCNALRSVIVTKSYRGEKYYLVLSMQGTVRLF